MKRIYKYPIKIEHKQMIRLPAICQTIHAGLDPKGDPCVWALVDPECPMHDQEIQIYGTGHPVEEIYLHHIGSFVQAIFMWHVFLKLAGDTPLVTALEHEAKMDTPVPR